jgi:hypothetical protein
LLFSCASQAFDEVSDWLAEMGCDDLLITYLEEQIESGTQQEQFGAANQLADLYKRFLSSDKYRNNKELLQRAIELLKKNSQIGNSELKVQLLRARYLMAEQIIENYRLRYADYEEASEEVTQLGEIANDLDEIRVKLIKRTRNSPERTDLYDVIGMATSLLAWSNYYIAWFENNDSSYAEKARNYFGMMIQAENPTFQQVPFDLKVKEYGARALLGIALCQGIILDRNVMEPWFDELLSEETHEVVRNQIPLWKFFLAIDYRDWKSVSELLSNAEHKDKLLYARLAATHALEHLDEPNAKNVSEQAVRLLTELDQLTMISELVDKYGSESLLDDGFISKYIEADLGYRQLVNDVEPLTPSKDNQVREEFKKVARQFSNATLANDASTHQEYLDDCYYMLGLCLFQAAEFEQAAKAFQTVVVMKNDEDSLWMAIVSLDSIQSPSVESQKLKSTLMKQYRSLYPDSNRGAQLLVRTAATTKTNAALINDLLSIPESDPNYQESQEQAAVHLYNLWRDAQETQVLSIGNKYLNVALRILSSRVKEIKASTAKELEEAIVIGLRTLEISLHNKIKRIVAAKQALETIELISSDGEISLAPYKKELEFRAILLALANGKLEIAQQSVLDLIEIYPQDLWSEYAARGLWNYWEKNGSEVLPQLRFKVGSRLLFGKSDDEIVSDSIFPISYLTSKAVCNFRPKSTDKNYEQRLKVLRIARLLLRAYPKTQHVLELNGLLEESSGDSQKALQHWRTLASGNKQGTDLWYQARLHLVGILAKTNRDEALEVLEQFHLLYPDYGKEPYASKFETLHHSLKGEEEIIKGVSDGN